MPQVTVKENLAKAREMRVKKTLAREGYLYALEAFYDTATGYEMPPQVANASLYVEATRAKIGGKR